MHKFIRYYFSVLIFLVSIAYSQTVQFVPDSTAKANLWHLTDEDTLWIGATFYYMDPSDSIIVSLESSESNDTGHLYCMVPGFVDSAIFLFTNKDTGVHIVNVTKVLQKQITPGTEIFFMYRHEKDQINQRYTGRNRPGIDPEDQLIYPGASFVSREFGLKPGYGHRWAAAGRIFDSVGTITDTIVFGFEDDGIVLDTTKDSLVAADFDFNDVIFKVTGLSLNVEPIPDSLVITAPDTVYAGDSIICRAEVWADSAGIKVRSSEFDTLIRWKLSGDYFNHDTFISSHDSATFFPRTAHTNFSLCISLKNPFTGDTLRTCKQIFVLPGKPQQLSLELRADTSSSSFSLNSPVEVSRIQISSNMINQSVYALFRDKFGNFCKFSKNTTWDTISVSSSLSPSAAFVRTGNRNIGEGIIEKRASGNIYVSAFETFEGDTFRDSILVNVASVSYDSLRIGIAEPGSIVYKSDLLITTDNCKELIAEGLRVDTDKWEAISVIWSTSGIWPVGSTNAQNGFKFCPNDTGKGFIKATFSGYLDTKLSVQVNPGAPKVLTLFTDNNKPFGHDTIAIAGSPLTLNARIFDKSGILLNKLKPDSIKWSLIETDTDSGTISSGNLTDTTGFQTRLIPLRAHRSIKVICHFGTLVDSVIIKIQPGKPHRIVIESHADWQRTKYAPAEIDTIEIPDDRINATVYALVRDSLGNYIDSLRAGSWNSTDSLVKVTEGTIPCIGSIRKNLQVKSGITSIIITSGNLIDTAFVKLLPYHYIALRITTNDSIPLDSLVMSTNFDTLLHVQGLRSDIAIWRKISAEWSIIGNLSITIPKPYNSDSLFISPTKPGLGYIKATLPGTQSLIDSISVTFTRGLPTRAEFAVITPSERLIAGDTIKAIVRIYNQDGLVPEEYCFNSNSASGSAVYQDTLNFKAKSIKARIFSDGNSAFINAPFSDTAKLSQCFVNGIDTVKFLLYYAPFGIDSLHQLSVKLGTIKASTASFRLKPSELNSISINHSNTCCPDTLVMRYPNDQVLLYTIGFDKFGNMRGEEPCNWSSTGTLHKFGRYDSVSRVIYGADSSVVHDDEAGFAIAISKTKTKVIDSLFIKIIGPLAIPVSATTIDSDGNGMIDMIKMKFDMPVSKSIKSINSRFNIISNSVIFSVDSTSILPDSVSMNIYLKETTGNKLQTNWKPQITMNNTGFQLAGAVELFTIEARDGVGPVIASVKKEITSNNRRHDLVTVTFSEEITGPDGNRFSLLELPERVFTTWEKNLSGEYKKIEFLKNIPNFNTPYFPMQVYFNMSNGIELTTQNFLNLRTDKAAYIIKDKDGNLPSVNNRKVKVEIYGTADNTLIIAPNPSQPSQNHEKPGVFHLRHNPQALNWIKQDKGGTAITFQIIPPEKGTTLGGRIIIFDAIGNVVVADPIANYKWMNLIKDGAVLSNEKKDNILPSTWNSDGMVYNYTIYWNGYTGNGTKAAPGVYKVVLKMFTKINGKTSVTQHNGFIGISK